MAKQVSIPFSLLNKINASIEQLFVSIRIIHIYFTFLELFYMKIFTFIGLFILNLINISPSNVSPIYALFTGYFKTCQTLDTTFGGHSSHEQTQHRYDTLRHKEIS